MKQLYFIAILPPTGIIEEIHQFKAYAAQHYNSRHAFRSPAHVTLQPPFFWESEKLEEVNTTLSAFAKAQTPFDVEFRDFDCFPPRVIYVNVVKSDDLLALRQHLIGTMEDQLGIVEKHRYSEYHPHTTIAFRDLKRKVFSEAWDDFSKQQYSTIFRANDLTLLVHEPSKGWSAVCRFPFGE